MFWEQHLIIRQNYNSEGTGATHLPLYFTHQPWIFIGRTDAEALILWQPDSKSQLIWKDPDAGKDRGREEAAAAADEMVRLHHWLSGYESEQTPGDSGRQGIQDSEGQGDLVCCSLWGCKGSQTQRLNNNNLMVQSSRGTWSHRLSWAECITVNWGDGAPGEDEEESQERRWGH